MNLIEIISLVGKHVDINHKEHGKINNVFLVRITIRQKINEITVRYFRGIVYDFDVNDIMSIQDISSVE